jgi:hypothetical protein
MITKRQLGITFIAIGSLAVVGLFVVDWIGASAFDGVGPVQRIALVVGGVLIVLGVPLLRLGDRPA